MNKQEMIEKVQALMQDEQFKEKLSQAEDLEAMAALFRNEGFEITGEDLKAAVEQQDGELSEENLENVAGGAFKFRYLNPFYWLGRLLAAATTSGMC